jgi:hypothetical protein
VKVQLEIYRTSSKEAFSRSREPLKHYTEVHSKVRILTRKRPSFKSGKAGAEAAQLE